MPVGGRGTPRSRNPFPDEVARAVADEASLQQLADDCDRHDRGLRDVWETIIVTGRRASEVIQLRLGCVGRYGGLPLLWHDQTKVGNLNAAARIPDHLLDRLEERRRKTLSRFADRQAGRPLQFPLPGLPRRRPRSPDRRPGISAAPRRLRNRLTRLRMARRAHYPPVSAGILVCEGTVLHPTSKEHQAVKVEIQPDVRDIAAQLGAGIPYALKFLVGQLADDPDMGRPSNLPGILTVTVHGAMFEDCPDLSVGYIREPDRIEIRFLRAALSTEPSTDAHDQELEDVRNQDQPTDPATAAVTVREVADAWRRITGWLQHNAPASYAALRAGASPAAIAALEEDLGIQIPVELHVLWLLTAGDDGGDGWGCLPGNRALMPLDAVAGFYRLMMDAQAREDALNAERSEDDRITVWKATWIPVVALGPADSTSGLYLDAASGYLGRWSRYDEGPGEVLDTLVTYLEAAAYMLEAPALATRDKPGLIGEPLVWLSSIDPAQEERWQSLTG